MKKFLMGILLLGAMATTLSAQTTMETPFSQKPAWKTFVHGHLSTAVLYNGARAVAGNNQYFWLQGGSAQFENRFWRGLGVVAEAGGQHNANINGSGVALDSVTMIFGPRYTVEPGRIFSHRESSKRISIYGQFLAGEAYGFHSLFPGASASVSSANALALQAGGGANLRLSRHFSARLIEADWQRTELPNNADNTQNNLHLGAGVVWNINQETSD
jgi:hypothetical protein